jgi:hypothetical protein
MREFGATSLKEKLIAAGFREVDFLAENVPDIGVFFDHDVSQPLIARKEKFAMEARTIAEFTDAYRTVQQELWAEQDRASQRTEQMRMAAGSRWVKMGRRLGIGPKLE